MSASPRALPWLGPPAAGGRVAGELDAIRAGAALLVLIAHVRALLFVPQEALERRGLPELALYAITALGHQAVMVFFVLSGFLVSGSVLRAVRERRWSWRWYLTRRLTRLYVVLVPALLLGTLWDRAGMSLFGADGVYGGHPANEHILGYSVAARSGIRELLGNAFFLQEIAVPPYGSNGVLWSLSYEFWYYLIFPCLVLAALGSARSRVAYAAASVLMLILVGGTIRLYFLIWLLGTGVAILAAVASRRRAPPWAVPVALAGAAASLVLPRLLGPGLPADLGTGLGCAALLCVLAWRAGAGDRPMGPLGRGGHVLSSFSYTLYLVHFPALVFLQAWLVARGVPRWQPAGWPLLWAAGIVAAVLMYAWGVSRLTEAKTELARRWIGSRFVLRGGEAPVGPEVVRGTGAS